MSLLRTILAAERRNPEGLCDWDPQWSGQGTQIERLEAAGLIEIKHCKACGMGDVDARYAKLTTKGHELLDKLARRKR